MQTIIQRSLDSFSLAGSYCAIVFDYRTSVVDLESGKEIVLPDDDS